MTTDPVLLSPWTALLENYAVFEAPTGAWASNDDIEVAVGALAGEGDAAEALSPATSGLD